MKKILMIGMLVSLFSAIALSSPPLQKKHKGQKTKDGDKITCVYCHKKNNIPKEGKDYKKFQSQPACAGSGCHGK